MEIKVVMLGTAGSSPTKTRSLPSVALVYDGDVMLFDCGEGTQMQMIKYGVNPSKLKALFISHTHGDHVIGIAGLVRTLSLNRRTEPLLIFVPRGHEGVIKALLAFDRAMIGYPIQVKGIKPGDEVYKGRGYSVGAFRLRHSVATCGYVFREDDKKRFIVERAKAAGVKGEMYSELQEKGKLKIGRKVVRLSDITTIQHGKSVVYASDTQPVTETARAAKGADLLIHECSYSENERELADERLHSTAEGVARIAKRANVKRLVLTHISARYNDAKVIEDEARRIFRNAEVASDGEVISV